MSPCRMWTARRGRGEEKPFPGTAALVPVLGAVAVIAAGEGAESANTHALAHALAHPWLHYVGDISYSLYLAHWPVVVVYPFITGRTVDGTFADGMTVLVLSWALAHACKCKWEDRFRARGESGDDQQSQPALLRSAWWLVACLSLGSLFAAALLLNGSRASPSARPDADDKFGLDGLCFGATNTSFPGSLYLGAEAVVRDAAYATPLCHVPLSKVLPSIDGAAKDTQPAYETLCYQIDGRAELQICHGDGSAFDQNRGQNYTSDHKYPVSHELKVNASSPHIVLLGDSHVLHWLPVFAAVGRRQGWRVTGLSRSSCLIATGDHKGSFALNGASDVPCRTWLANALAFIADQRPTAVVLTAWSGYHHFNKAFKDSPDALEEASKGVERTIAAIQATGVNVLAIKETPRAAHDIPTCLASAVQRLGEGNATTACTMQAADCLKDGPLNRAARVEKTKLLSFDDAFCSADGACAPIFGNVLAFRDKHHLTKTFGMTLAPSLERRILAALPML